MKNKSGIIITPKNNPNANPIPSQNERQPTPNHASAEIHDSNNEKKKKKTIKHTTPKKPTPRLFQARDVVGEQVLVRLPWAAKDLKETLLVSDMGV